MFEHHTNNINVSHDRSKIFKNQSNIFKHYLGITPSMNVRLHSPFRSDSRPDCRFEAYKGVWYFIDNATYKNKLQFNCIDLVMYMFDVSYREACNMIMIEVPLGKVDEVPHFSFTPVIRFKYTKWVGENYFTKNCDLPNTYLNKQPVYKVMQYFANSKTSDFLKPNIIYNPRIVDTIAYQFENRVKLYFPEQEFRFYSSCTNDDIFGFHRFGDYLFSKDIIITKSGKDEMVANYHLNVPTLAVQQETTRHLPDKVMRNLGRFDNIYVWYDADYTGRIWSKYMTSYINSFYPNKAKNIMHDIQFGNDITEIYQNNKRNLIKVYESNL